MTQIESIDKRTFDQLRALIYQRSGISLGEGKETLVAARLGKRMRALGLATHQAYLQYAMEHEAEGELAHLLDAISTNFTSFFRESDHFELLSRLLEQWLAAGQQRLRIWSAACSTGEEPYTIAMVLRQAIGSRQVDTRVLATDISTRVLARARAGIYSAQQLKTVPAALRGQAFTPAGEGAEGDGLIRPELREMIVFKRLNLSTPPFPMQGPFDAIFCRNVMIYFDGVVRRRLLGELRRLLDPGGYLFVGHAESLSGMAEGLDCVRPSVYTKAACPMSTDSRKRAGGGTG